MAKTPVPTYKSWEEADKALALFASADAKLDALKADMADEIQRAKFAIAEDFEPQIEPVADAHKTLFSALRKWFKKRVEDCEGDAKSATRLHGTLQIRTSPPKVSPLDPDWEEDDLIESLEREIPKFVREVKVVDREGILRAYAAKEISAETLARAGIEITQDEKFSIDLSKCSSVAQSPLGRHSLGEGGSAVA